MAKVVRLQLFSDLHTEFINLRTEWWKMPHKSFLRPDPEADLLILAGDIGILNVPKHRQLEKLLRYCSKQWKQVVYVPGNHEFYSRRKSILHKQIDYATFCDSLPNVHFLCDQVKEIPIASWGPGATLPIYGMVGWTSPRALAFRDQYVLRDFRFHSAQDIEEMSQRSLRSFQQWMRSLSPDANVLVVSHFPPFQTGTSDPKYVQSPNRSLNQYFAWPDRNPYLQTLSSKPVVRGWFSGHTHWSYHLPREETNTLFASNQLGYESESVPFSTSGVITMTIPTTTWKQEE